jgi:hypothetical protein
MSIVLSETIQDMRSEAYTVNLNEYYSIGGLRNRGVDTDSPNS